MSHWLRARSNATARFHCPAQLRGNRTAAGGSGTAIKFALIGYLSAGEPKERAFSNMAFKAGLRHLEFLEGRNVAIEYR
jgi:hypothetical protein